MKNVHRFACIASAIPLLFYVYACSSSDSGGATTPDDDGGSSGSSGSSSGTSGSSSGTSGSSGSSGSSGTSGGLDAGDASDSSSPICVGNPLLSSPDASTPDGGVSADAAAVSQIVAPMNNGRFLDGPQWVDQDGGAGFLVYSEYLPNQELWKINGDGGTSTALRTAGFVNGGGDNPTLGPVGNAFRSGAVLTAVQGLTAGSGGIFQTYADAATGPTIPIPSDSSPINDLVVGKGGQIYFTAPGFTGDFGEGIYQTAADAGGASLVTPIPSSDKPNGIAISPDGTKLYVSFSGNGGGNLKRIDAYTIPATGTIVAPATAAAFIASAKLTDIPDGIAVDNAGNVYVAEANVDPGTKSGEVEVFSPAGVKLGKIPFTSDRPTSVGFGGKDKTELFITVEDGVYVFTGRCIGIP